MSSPVSDVDRASFLRGLAALGVTALAGRASAASPLKTAARAPVASGSGAYDFWFTRLRYDSGDWDLDQKMPSNIITSLIDYTNLRVDPKEHVLPLADPRMLTAPFCYLTGHKLVEFNAAERRNFERYVRSGGFVFVDDCNHDIDGLFAKSFEKQMSSIFGSRALKPLPKTHPIFRRFFKFAGPPPTGLELNGWGDDLVHDYIKGIDINGRLGVLYSNKDYGCEWDYDWHNKRFLAEDNTKFGVNIVMYALTS
ncbi:DUF4159 domain-containing protein [Caulobacter sp. S45]|uniref:DUF4159 domain-containing protein n=1 Tax=Caulobacter sp. S45 TaxID=1641861 RepID=UPI00131B5ACC|nr:DUF4159 domain-containing protein [Caulobacter sp. S45]